MANHSLRNKLNGGASLPTPVRQQRPTANTRALQLMSKYDGAKYSFMKTILPQGAREIIIASIIIILMRL